MAFHPPPPSAPGAPSAFDQRMQKLSQLAGMHEIRPDWIVRLRALESFDVVCILDDSGSMGTAVTTPATNPYATRVTRWDELRTTASTIVELATAATAQGVDCVFLNRPAILGATSAAQVQLAFNHAPPSGFTPLTRTLKAVLAAKANTERDLLVIIATDGEPTNEQNRPDVASFIRALSAKGPRVFVQ